MARVFDDMELGYLKAVLDSGRLGWQSGGMVTRFEEAFAELVGAKYAIGRNSAMTALAQAVTVSGAGTGWEVLCDPIVHFGGPRHPLFQRRAPFRGRQVRHILDGSRLLASKHQPT